MNVFKCSQIFVKSNNLNTKKVHKTDISELCLSYDTNVGFFFPMHIQRYYRWVKIQTNVTLTYELNLSQVIFFLILGVREQMYSPF